MDNYPVDNFRRGWGLCISMQGGYLNKKLRARLRFPWSERYPQD